MKRGHIPVRTCLVCMRKRPKAELARLGLDAESGRILEDSRGKMKGRGGYACRECLPGLRLDRRIQRAFRNRAKEICVPENRVTGVGCQVSDLALPSSVE